MKKVLVIKLRGIGDAVLALPAIKALKQSHAQAQVTAIMPPPALQVLEHSPDVNRRVAWKRGREIPIGLGLRGERFDCLVNFHASPRSAFLGYLSGARRRVIHDHSGRPWFGSVRVPDATVRKSAIERDLDAVRALNLPVLLTSRPEITLEGGKKEWARQFLEENGVKAKAPVTVAIGASNPSKRWPEDRFGHMCKRISERGTPVILLTQQTDSLLLPRFFAECPQERILHLQDFPLRKVIALLWASRLYIGNDSGIKHLACALGTPTLTLFGPEDVEEWHPYRREDGHEVIQKNVACRGRGCGLVACEPLTCLREITVEEVMEKAQTMLASIPRADESP